jgi:septal ring factor EnvC (AmiA/AmiB activator)
LLDWLVDWLVGRTRDGALLLGLTREAHVCVVPLLFRSQKQEISQSKQMIAHLSAELALNKNKVKEKEQALTKGQHALAAARKDNTVLQNFISLLEHRIAELEEREAPAVDHLIQLREQINEMNDGGYRPGRPRSTSID